MRLFVAFELPPEVRLDLDRRTRSLRRVLPRARWVKPEAMHLTMVFLGDTDPSRLGDLHRELAGAFATAAPMEMRIAEIGAFPTRGRRRVVWVGIDATGSLEGLQTRLSQAVERAVEIELPRRPYHPHLTLARCKPSWPPREVERLAAAFGPRPAGSFPVDRGSLLASELHPSGARYRTVESYPLGDAR